MSIMVKFRSLSIGGLEKLARHADPSVRSKVSEKLLQRISRGLGLEEAERILKTFDCRVVTPEVIDGLYEKNSSRIVAALVIDHPNTSRGLLLRIIAEFGPDDIVLSAFRRIDKITVNEIERLAIGKLHPLIAAMIAQHPRVGRMALINILKQSGLESPTYRNAFSRISADMTFSEIRYVSITAAPEVMSLLLRYNRLTPAMAAEIISNRIKRSEEAVRQVDDGRLVEDCFTWRWETIKKEEIELIYGKKDLEQAIDLMQMSTPRFEFKQLLEAMDKVNPELAAGIKRLISPK